MKPCKARAPVPTVLFLLLLRASVASAQETEPTAPAEEAPARRDQLGPFELRAASGDTLRVGFIGQVQTAVDNTEDSSSGERTTDYRVFLRRVRLRLDARLLDDRLSLAFQLSTAPFVPELMDISADYRLLTDLRLRLGQFKIPFTRHRSMSFTQLVLADWSIAATHFGAERQIGAMAHNSRREGSGLTYAAGVFTGVNARASFATGVAHSHAESTPSPSNLRDPAPAAGINPEIVLHLSHGSEGIDAHTNTDARGGSLRHLVGLSFAWDLDPDPARDFALRLAPELLLKLNGVSLNLVFYAGFFEPDDPALAPASLGGTAELAWRIRPMWEVSGRYSRFDVLADLREEARRRADETIAEADPQNRANLEDQYATAGQRRSAQEALLGLNLYLVEHSLKLQLDGGWLRATGATTLDDLIVRLQAQIAL